MNADHPQRFARKALRRTAPIRAVGGFYRTAEDRARGLGGIPLSSAEDAVVAAVRLAYKVADEQIERSTRLARRLREAGERATGPDGDERALDAAEQLVFRSMVSGLSWLEGVVAEDGSPLKRLAAVQYRLLGSLLGLAPGPAERGRTNDGPRREPGSDGDEGSQRSRGSDRGPARRIPKIRHVGKVRRAVRVSECAMEDDPVAGELALTFYSEVDCAVDQAIPATMIFGSDGNVVLAVDTPRGVRAGSWSAAICRADGSQLGVIRIVL